jgi:hypothetical protein
MDRTMKLVRRARGEDGIAMILALGVSFVLFLFVLATVSLSLHSNRSSSLDRKRVSALAAAEAGINYYLSALDSSSQSTVPCSVTQALSDSAASTFNVTPTFYDASGVAVACPFASGVTPTAVLIHSEGSTGNSSRLRIMESYVALTSGGGGGFATGAIAAYGTGGSSISGSTQVLAPPGGGTSDVYYGGNVTISSSGTVQGSLYGQGTVTLNGGGTVNGDIWSNGKLSLSGTSQVFGNATTSLSTADISMSSQAHVHGNARAGRLITMSGSAVIDGTKTQNAPQGPPPTAAGTFPTFTFNAADWQAQGFTIRTYTSCTTALTDMQSIGTTLPIAKYVFRLTGGAGACTFTVGGSKVVNVRADLALILDGGFTINSGSGFANPDATGHTLYVFAGLGNATPCTSAELKMSGGFLGQASDPGVLTTLLYTPCSASTSSSAYIRSGQLLVGGAVNMSGGGNFTSLAIEVPGYSTGWSQSIAYIREVHP